MKYILLITSLTFGLTSFAQSGHKNHSMKKEKTKPLEQSYLRTVGPEHHQVHCHACSCSQPIPKDVATVQKQVNQKPAAKKQLSPKTKAEIALIKKRLNEYRKLQQTPIKENSLYLTFGLLSDSKNNGLEFERRGNHWGAGFFIVQSNETQKDSSVRLEGFSTGLTGHYHFNPARYSQTRRVFDSGLYFKLGVSKFNSTHQENLPMYLTGGFGLDTSYLLSPKHGISGYGRIGMNYLYHSDPGVYLTGTDFSLGIKWSF